MSSAAIRRIAIAAGGTGGHMMPAHALEIELRRRGHSTLLITDRRGADFPGLFGGVDVRLLDSGRMSGGTLAKAKAALRIALNAARARKMLKVMKPDAVIGFGGYPALPALLAARSLSIPTCLHEQNAVLGRVNRLLARSATAIALSYEETALVPAAAAMRAVSTGNPVREEVARLAYEPYPQINGEHMLRILVVGGSLGAQVLADVVPDALALLPQHLKARLQVTQQCRSEDMERVRKRFADAGIAAELATYLEDLPERLLWTHLVVARGGASTLAELAVAGRPSILVPLPIATDDHQTANARIFERVGAAWPIQQPDFTPAALAKRIQKLALDPVRLCRAATAAQRLGRPDAAASLADLVESVAVRRSNGARQPAEPSRGSVHPPSIDKREGLA